MCLISKEEAVLAGLGYHDTERLMSTRSPHLDAGLTTAFYFPLYEKV